MGDWSAYVERRWPDPPGPVSQLDLFADPQGGVEFVIVGVAVVVVVVVAVTQDYPYRSGHTH
jgi:hypothetical protein